MRVARYSELPWRRWAGVRRNEAGDEDTISMEKPHSGYKRLFQGTAGEPGNFEMVISSGDGTGGSHMPRHRHDFDQLRYPLVGTPEWSPGHVTPPGTVAYFPAGTHYGPYDRYTGEHLHIQFEGANGAPFLHYERLVEARQELAKRGTFEKGVYSWLDDKGVRHNMDAHEAAIELITGGKLSFPSPRFSSQIDMNPENFAWLDAGPGIQIKELARFTEREARIGMLRLEGSASHRLESASQRTLLFVTSGVGTADGEPIEERDAIALEKDEQGLIATTSRIELLLLALPKLAPASPANAAAQQQLAGVGV
jgi:hypothetical protein